MSSEIILIYVLKSTFITAIMYGYYRLALKDNKFHYYNRFYLLGSLVLSLVIPLLNFHWFTFEKLAAKTTGEEILLMIAEPGVRNKVNNLMYSDWIFMFIIMIGISLLVLLAISIVKIYKIKRHSPVRHLEGIEFIETDVENAPFSFLNNLFWKKGIQLNDENGQKIFKHELTHIRQKHSLDRIFCQIISSIFWINPLNWIIQKELETIHEFIADEEAVGENNTEAFAKLLLETHYGTHFLNPIHAFNYSSIKRRLAMLTKSTKTEYSYLRRVMALPLILIALAIFSIKVNAVEKVERIGKQLENVYYENLSDTIIPKLPVVPEPPIPPMPPMPEVKPVENNEYKTMILERDNENASIEQKKFIIIYGKATISDLKTDDIESIRVINIEGVKWQEAVKPDVDQNIISDIENAVKRNKGIKAMYISATDIHEIRADTIVFERKTKWNRVKMNDQVVYMLDGKIINSSSFKNIKPNDIQSITVLKGENAQRKYGDLQGNDVIEIILKKK